MQSSFSVCSYWQSDRVHLLPSGDDEVRGGDYAPSVIGYRCLNVDDLQGDHGPGERGWIAAKKTVISP